MKITLEDHQKDTIESLAQTYGTSSQKLMQAFEEMLDSKFDDLIEDFLTNHIEEVL